MKIQFVVTTPITVNTDTRENTCINNVTYVTWLYISINDVCYKTIYCFVS